MKIHIDRNGERFGPYSIEEINAYLAAGTLLPSDLAWKDGMTDWLPVHQISGVVAATGSVATSVLPSQSVSIGNKKDSPRNCSRGGTVGYWDWNLGFLFPSHRREEAVCKQ